MTQTISQTQTYLTPQDHAFFLEHGYLIVKNVLPPDIIAEAVAFLEGDGFEGEVGAANYQPRQGDPVRACVTDTVYSVLSELMGPNYVLPRKNGAMDMPRPYTPEKSWESQGFHVDSDYPTRLPNEDILSHFIFLTPVRSHGGAFQYAPGSPLRYFAAMGDNPEGLVAQTALPELSGPIREFLAEPGDMLVMTHLGGHAGSNNVTDPQTRHALLDRYDADKRLVPGLKPLAEMSSVEKVYSARFLREQRGMDVPSPSLVLNADTDAALRDGIVLAPDVLYHVTYLERASPVALFVTASQPGVLQRAASTDFVHWTVEPAFEMPGASFAVLHEHKRDGSITLFAGGTFPRREVHLLTGPDMKALTVTQTVPDAAFAFGHYTTDYGSQQARGRVLFVRPADAPNRLVCHWGKTWAEARANAQNSEVVTLPDGHAFRNAFVAPSNAGPPFALVADVQNGLEPAVPFYSLSHDMARFATAPQLLPFDAESVLCGIRVYARARSYWLVTYLRVAAGESRLFWGVIDWESPTPCLAEIRTAAALQEAHCIVGLL